MNYRLLPGPYLLLICCRFLLFFFLLLIFYFLLDPILACRFECQWNANEQKQKYIHDSSQKHWMPSKIIVYVVRCRYLQHLSLSLYCVTPIIRSKKKKSTVNLVDQKLIFGFGPPNSNEAEIKHQQKFKPNRKLLLKLRQHRHILCKTNSKIQDNKQQQVKKNG